MAAVEQGDAWMQRCRASHAGSTVRGRERTSARQTSMPRGCVQGLQPVRLLVGVKKSYLGGSKVFPRSSTPATPLGAWPAQLMAGARPPRSGLGRFGCSVCRCFPWDERPTTRRTRGRVYTTRGARMGDTRAAASRASDDDSAMSWRCSKAARRCKRARRHALAKGSDPDNGSIWAKASPRRARQALRGAGCEGGSRPQTTA